MKRFSYGHIVYTTVWMHGWLHITRSMFVSSLSNDVNGTGEHATNYSVINTLGIIACIGLDVWYVSMKCNTMPEHSAAIYLITIATEPNCDKKQRCIRTLCRTFAQPVGISHGSIMNISKKRLDENGYSPLQFVRVIENR